MGQFTSADTVADGLNRYGYVRGNPETYSDPSGHVEVPTDMRGGAPPGEAGVGGGTGSGVVPGGPGDILGNLYRSWARFLGISGTAPVGAVIPLGGGAAVQVILEAGTLTITYQYRDHTTATYDATNAPRWLQEYWLQVLSEHAAGDPYDTTRHRPGRLMYTNLSSQQRADALADAFEGTDPIATRSPGFSTDISVSRQGKPGVVQIRAMDPAANAMFTDNGPYLRAEVTKGGMAGPLDFNGRRDNSIDHTHFELGNDGEQNDLILQYALMGTILYQWQNP